MKWHILWVALVLLLGIGITAQAELPDTPPVYPDFLGEGARVTELYTTRDEIIAADMAMQLPYESVYAPTLNEAMLYLLSGRADYFLAIAETVQYLASRNDQFVALEDESATMLRMVIRHEEEALAQAIDGVLEEMLADGTMEALYQEHIAGVIDGGEAQRVEPAVYEGARTILVGVSGDMPPIDYVTEAGVPAGFNTAVAAELAGRLEMNIEFVPVDSGARFVALHAGKIDLFFWELIPEVPAEMIETTEQIMDAHISIPYLNTFMGWLALAGGE